MVNEWILKSHQSASYDESCRPLFQTHGGDGELVLVSSVFVTQTSPRLSRPPVVPHVPANHHPQYLSICFLPPRLLAIS